jgi:hypothetical protein
MYTVMAHHDEQLISEWVSTRDNERVSIQAVLVPAEEHRDLTSAMPGLHYERRRLARTMLGPLALDQPDRTRFVAVHDVVTRRTPSGYTGNALMGSSEDVYTHQTQYDQTIKDVRAAVGFRLSSEVSPLASLRHGDNKALLTCIGVADIGDAWERRKYASLAVLATLQFLAERPTRTVVSATGSLERNRLWQVIEPAGAGLQTLASLKNAPRYTLSRYADDALRGYRAHLVKTHILGGNK